MSGLNSFIMQILFVFAFIALPCISKAQRLSDSEVKERITAFFADKNNIKLGTNKNNSTSQFEKAYVADSSLLQIYDFSDGEGFVVATTDASLPAVVGYSENGNAVEAMKIPAFADAIAVYDKFADKNITNSISSPETKLVSRLLLETTDFPESVEPLLTDEWEQYSPYYMFTPVIDSVHCLTGCIAHSMAEIMRYYKYPESGIGTHTYTDADGCGQTLTVDFSESVYDWDNMLDRYDEGLYTEEEAIAVAKLLYDCGVSVDMTYSTSGSGAKVMKQPYALVKYFGYDSGAQIYYRNLYTLNEWYNMLKSDLSNGMPIMMTGSSVTQSHAFTCDGYDSNDYFHINWGWAGEANGYYYLPFLSPDLPAWYDKNNPERGLNLYQIVCLGVKPKGEQDSDEVHMFAFSYLNTFENAVSRTDSFSVEICDMANLGWNLFDGQIGLVLKNDDDFVKLLAEYEHDFLLESIADTVYTDTLEMSIPDDVENGTYRLVPALYEGGTWKEIRTELGTPNYVFVEVADDSVSFVVPSEEMANLELVEISFPDTLYSQQAPSYSVTITNNGAEYFGIVSFALENISGDSDVYAVFSQQGLTIGKNETTTRTFSRTPLNISVGNYRLRIFYSTDLYSNSQKELYNSGDRKIAVVRSSVTDIESVDVEKEELSEIQVYNTGGFLVDEVRGCSLDDYLKRSSLVKGVYIITDGERKKKIVR